MTLYPKAVDPQALKKTMCYKPIILDQYSSLQCTYDGEDIDTVPVVEKPRPVNCHVLLFPNKNKNAFPVFLACVNIHSDIGCISFGSCCSMEYTNVFVIIDFCVERRMDYHSIELLSNL